MKMLPTMIAFCVAAVIISLAGYALIAWIVCLIAKAVL